jgi:branched-chain amino acid transport system substrate-binding protein
MSTITGDLAKDREALMTAMAGIKKFEGITGDMSYPATGAHDPIKCAVVVKIDDAGKFGFYKSVCP